MKFFVYCLFFIFFLSLSWGFVFAQSSDNMFDEYDSNSDNELTADEFTSYYNTNVIAKCGNKVERMKAIFTEDDENGDGFISADESEFVIKRFSSNPRTAHMVVDGKVSRDNFIKCPVFTVQQIFEDFDQDKNGTISKHEWDLRKREGYAQ